MIDYNELKYLISDWHSLLIDLGIPSELLVKKGTPCPICGGDDRFTYDNRFKKGDGYCRSCGHLDGVDMLKGYHNKTFPEIVEMIASYLGVEDYRNDKLQKRLERDREDRWYYEAKKFVALFEGAKHLSSSEKKESKRHFEYINKYEAKYPHKDYSQLLREIAKKMPRVAA